MLLLFCVLYLLCIVVVLLFCIRLVCCLFCVLLIAMFLDLFGLRLLMLVLVVLLLPLLIVFDRFWRNALILFLLINMNLLLLIVLLYNSCLRFLICSSSSPRSRSSFSLLSDLFYLMIICFIFLLIIPLVFF